MNKKALWAIPATIAVVAISGAAARFVTQPNNDNKRTGSSEQQTLKNESTETGNLDQPLISETPTPTLTPTPQVIVTVTSVPTVTASPVPTAYKKWTAPTNSREQIDNQICAVFGESECNAAIQYGTFGLVYESRYKKETSAPGIYTYAGIFRLRCYNTVVQEIAGTTDVKLCAEKLNDDTFSINALKAYRDAHGFPSTMQIH